MNNRIITISTMANGGIKSVVENYNQANLFAEFEHSWLCAHKEGSVFFRCRLFIKCIFELIAALFNGVGLFHVHMAMRGSFFRKMFLISLIKLFKRKVILHLHGSEFEVFYKNSKPSIQQLIVKTFEKADVVIVLSESWKKFVANLSGEIHVEVVPNFVQPIKSLCLNQLDTGTKFIFLGALGKRKGIYDLLPAFQKLLNIEPTAKLIIGGDGELTQAQQLAQRLGIGHAVEFVGWVSGEEKTKWLNQADVFILPSYNEGLPMAILEAMSLGKCVISTYVGGIPEAISTNDNGLLVAAGNVEQIFLAMKQACDKDVRTRLGDAAKNAFEANFSPTVITPKIKHIYRSLL
ncbi:glycosyltransferase family 4 protein [Catenovulum agarivorans]|uniref:glycosyltransferase family 4 protein n=1 Tax=Catenovulum agarivorans TaxID=1172192 RepID=UPI0002DEC86F|nr:glycosyltransferase family 4 protein [Catenovulum agarivorans]